MITKTLVGVLWNLLLKIVDYLNHRGGHKISLEEGPENIWLDIQLKCACGLQHPWSMVNMLQLWHEKMYLGDMSYWRQVDRCCNIDSIVCRGCCLQLKERQHCNHDFPMFVVNTPPGDPEVLLKRSWQRRKNCLSRLVGGERLFSTTNVLLPEEIIDEMCSCFNKRDTRKKCAGEN